MSITTIENTGLLIIDIQEKLLNAVFNKSIVEKKAQIIAKASNILKLPIFVTEQYPNGLGETVELIKTNLSQDAKFYEKTAFNALLDENLCDDLQNKNIKNIIVTGIETHICVHQTVDALLEKGYAVTVLSDCCGSRNQDEYISALNVMSKNGALIKSTEMVLFELLKTAKHPNFKEIQALIK